MTTEFAYLPVRLTRALYSALAALVGVRLAWGAAFPLDVLLIGAAGSVGVWLVARSVRIGLSVGPDGVVVANVFRTYRVPLDDVGAADTADRVDLIQLRFVTLWHAPCVRILRRSGGTVTAYGAAGPKAQRAAEAIRAVMVPKA